MKLVLLVEMISTLLGACDCAADLTKVILQYAEQFAVGETIQMQVRAVLCAQWLLDATQPGALP